MKLAIMQPYFFPYLGYWQLLGAVDKYVIYDDVTYIKGGWINRNSILLNGERHLITIPLENASSFKKIKDTEIVKNEKVISKLIKTIEMAYKRAPYFNEVMPMISNLLKNNSNITQLNYNTALELKKYFDLKTEILLSSQIAKNDDLKGQDKVIHINKILNADIYYNAIGGMELYSTSEFKKNGIELKFLEMNNIEYKQFDNQFVPYLSIIDVLMFNSKKEVQNLLNKYSLVTNTNSNEDTLGGGASS